MEGKVKSAVLNTALSFHYQALIGLDRCFSLQPEQSVWFEKDGDVSLIGNDIEYATQTEVKNYADTLTDHHENLWKTLKNWLDPLFQHEKYGSLILHTTQPFGLTTRLKNWNSQTAEQRFDILKKIFNERTNEELEAEKPKEIVKLQKEVMQTSTERLNEILKKVVLFTEADDLELLKKEYSQNQLEYQKVIWKVIYMVWLGLCMIKQIRLHGKLNNLISQPSVKNSLLYIIRKNIRSHLLQAMKHLNQKYPN